MLLKDVEVGKVYVVKLSTGRMARMRVERKIEPSRFNKVTRLELQDVDKPGLTKFCTAAKLKYPAGGIVVPEGVTKTTDAF